MDMQGFAQKLLRGGNSACGRQARTIGGEVPVQGIVVVDGVRLAWLIGTELGSERCCKELVDEIKIVLSLWQHRQRQVWSVRKQGSHREHETYATNCVLGDLGVA